jgi:rhodanese-related sulfurtransferase
VDINKKGANNYERSISEPKFLFKSDVFADKNAIVVDIRKEDEFKKNHISGSINIMAQSVNDKLETWLGSIIKPEEKFYVVLSSVEEKDEVLHRIAKIGYESQLLGLLTLDDTALETSEPLDLDDFKKYPEHYTIVDIRNRSELEDGKIFENAIAIPLNDLRDSKDKIPTDKPIVVHCAGGYRSAAGSSIISKLIDKTSVYDLSDAVKQFKN